MTTTAAPTTIDTDRWEHHAACRGVPTNWFYQLTHAAIVATYCNDCPVIDACRADVLAMPARIRWTGQYRAGRWWAASNHNRRETNHA